MSFENAFEHSEALFEAALAEFAEKGYEQASINTILKAAGMSKGQFYYHFADKEALYLSLIDIVIARKREFLQAEMQPGDFQGDLFSILGAQIRHGFAFAQAQPLVNRFAESFLREQGNAIYKKALATHNFQDDTMIQALIDRAIENGDLREDLPRSFLKKVIGYLLTHSAELAELDEFGEAEANLGYLIEFMKSGLGRQD